MNQLPEIDRNHISKNLLVFLDIMKANSLMHLTELNLFKFALSKIS